jgi:hypothetical protein
MDEENEQSDIIFQNGIIMDANIHGDDDDKIRKLNSDSIVATELFLPLYTIVNTIFGMEMKKRS